MTKAELDAAVREMRKKCSFSPEACRKALKRSRGDVDGALFALIDAGELRTWHLNPETVPVELFGRAEAHSMARDVANAKMLFPTLGGMMGDLMEEIGKMTGEEVDVPPLPELKLKPLPKSKLPPEPPKKTDLKAIRALGRKVRARVLRDWQLKQKMKEDDRRRREIRRDWPKVLKAPPFPALKIDPMDQQWTGRETLATWARFKGSRKGAVDVTIDPPEDIESTPESPGPRPLPEQFAAYRYLKENEAKVTGAILEAVLRYYNELREEPGYEADEDDEELYMPPLQGVDGLKNLIHLSEIVVLSYAKGGVAYVGLAMRCKWDEEHGLGVMTHKSRVVEVGQADVSFDHFAAKDDGGKALTSA